MKEVLAKVNLLREFTGKNGHRFAAIEGNNDCNRRCESCLIPQTYNQESELTVKETFNQVDWVYRQGFRLLSYLGGEPLAPFKTKENITFLDHTKEVIKYAKKKGMTVNITTNGDYVNEEVIKSLQESGLDALTFSLHSNKEAELDNLIEKAKIAAKAGFIPTIHPLLTAENADKIVDMAYKTAESGIFFQVAILQEKGMSFSALPKGKSIIPTIEQQNQVFEKLLKLKSYGFVINNRSFLKNAINYPNNNWRCDPEKDAFIHVGNGFIDVCSEVRTGLKTEGVDLKDKVWREEKEKLVENCGNCLHQCYFESQNPSLVGDIPTLAVMGLIRAGKADLVEKLGKHAVRRIRGSRN